MRAHFTPGADPLLPLAFVLCGALATAAPVAKAQDAAPEGAPTTEAKDAAAAQEGTGSRLIVVPYPIVDPAIGNGLLVGPVWMRDGPRPATGPRRPQAYGAGAIWTDGGTRGLVAFDHRAWRGGAWRTTALAAKLDLHFSYAGLLPEQADDFSFAIRVEGGGLSGERMLGAGPNSLSFSLFSVQADVSFDQLPPVQAESDIGAATIRGLRLGWARDTRDDVFLPSTGSAQAVTITAFPESMGSSFDAQTVDMKWTSYRRLGHGVIGLRGKAALGFGNTPFYLRPFISFRGVAALQYAGERVFSLEAEYRRPLHRRWDALVFAGTGHATSDFRGIERGKTASAAGAGVRFRPAKLFGLTVGLDFAQGPEGLVGYIQIGNAWTN